ncbi:MAG: TatD family hydrolase, partial [Rikenellaceae bacterium]|nr:TatD family hydrolase [Rikenellaceae bacterium]
EVVAAMSLDDMVLETDSPYLSPVPFRGRRNESCRIPLIASRIAEIKGCSAEEVARATTANALRMFRL